MTVHACRREHSASWRRRAWALAACALPSLAAIAARGQTLDRQRSLWLVVGAPANAAPVDRVDGARTGMARFKLPASSLRIEWRAPVGALLAHAPLVDANGDTYVAGTRGEVVALKRDGTELWRAVTGSNQPGPPALLSDRTLVFVDDAGEAVGVREGRVRFRWRFGQAGATHPAPLALDDGGAVVATAHELAVLDAEGTERARTTFAEAVAAPLVAALDKVFVVTSSGAVWAWQPGASEPTRVASFGSAVDGGAALADDHTLIAVIAAPNRMGTVNLVRGTSTLRAGPYDGLWGGPPTMKGGTAYLWLHTAVGEFAVAVDPGGAEIGRTLLAGHPSARSSDGGMPPLVTGPHIPALIDSRGTVVFAMVSGSSATIGAASATGTGGSTVELLPDVCPPAPVGEGADRIPAPPIVGLAPLPPAGFVAACASGTLLAVRASEG